MKISLITAVFNNASCIDSCIESIRGQSYPDIEHIIIDGGSTDGTLDVIDSRTSHASRTTRVVSEPDSGIYDALNKGIELATGDVIGFLHSDDVYADATVLGKVAKVMTDQNVDSCYGDLMYVKDNGVRSEVGGQRSDKDEKAGCRSGLIDNESGPTQTSNLKPQNFEVVRYWKSRPFNRGLFRKGWMPPHPTFFARREIYEKLGMFNTDFTIAADYELMLRFLWENNISTWYMPEVLIKMRTGGTSNKSLRNMVRKSAEDYRAMRMHGVGGIPTLARKNLSKVPQFFKKTRANIAK